MRYRYYKNRSGFIAFVTMFLLLVFGLMGIAYLYSSRMNTDMLFVESQRLKARNYAQAGIEKVKINMCNICQRSKKYDMSSSSCFPKEYVKEFEDGGYRVISVEPFVFNGKEYKNVKHYVKGRLMGEFDVWEITVEGYSKKVTRSVVEIKTIMRIFRDSIVY